MGKGWGLMTNFKGTRHQNRLLVVYMQPEEFAKGVFSRKKWQLCRTRLKVGDVRKPMSTQAQAFGIGNAIRITKVEHKKKLTHFHFEIIERR